MALVRRTASSASGTRVTVTVGPNVSSRTADDVSGTSTSTVGGTKGPPSAGTSPPTTARPPCSTASRTCRRMTSTWPGMVIGPNDAPSSDPARSRRARSVSSATKASWTASVAYTRSIPMQVWPALLMEPHSAASAAAATSASSSTIIASLPPHSISTGTRFSAQAAMTRRPVVAEPVNATLSTPARVRAAPVSPRPVTTWSTSGRSGTAIAHACASHRPTPGVYSLGLKTTALPAARA